MLRESIIDRILFKVKKLIPGSVFNFFQPTYHTVLAYTGALLYGFPSKKLKVIGVTGTKGKSTVVFLISKILEIFPKPGFGEQQKPDLGRGVAACGSLGFKIREKEWPNTLKMTMPGRFRLQKLMAEAVRAGCEYFVLEVTAEGIKQKRHLGIQFDCAVFTNLHREHIESHGSFEKYYQAKQELFEKTKNIHVISADDPNFGLFSKFSASRTIFYGLKKGDLMAQNLNLSNEGSSFEVYGTVFNTYLAGEFNVMNCLAAFGVGVMYGLDLPTMKPVLESIKYIPGRMEFVQREPFSVVIDYAHTPDSLEAVYRTLKFQIPNSKSQINSKFEFPNPKLETSNQKPAARLLCVLGAAGGGRDKWKRPEFGRIAAEYCDEIILTNEDPYDEIPEKIIEDIFSGISSSLKFKSLKVTKVLDRREAIKKALTSAREGDILIITGKGSETSMAVAGGRKIPWSDRDVVRKVLRQQGRER